MKNYLILSFVAIIASCGGKDSPGNGPLLNRNPQVSTGNLFENSELRVKTTPLSRINRCSKFLVTNKTIQPLNISTPNQPIYIDQACQQFAPIQTVYPGQHKAIYTKITQKLLQFNLKTDHTSLPIQVEAFPAQGVEQNQFNLDTLSNNQFGTYIFGRDLDGGSDKIYQLDPVNLRFGLFESTNDYRKNPLIVPVQNNEIFVLGGFRGGPLEDKNLYSVKRISLTKGRSSYHPIPEEIKISGRGHEHLLLENKNILIYRSQSNYDSIICNNAFEFYEFNYNQDKWKIHKITTPQTNCEGIHSISQFSETQVFVVTLAAQENSMDLWRYNLKSRESTLIASSTGYERGDKGIDLSSIIRLNAEFFIWSVSAQEQILIKIDDFSTYRQKARGIQKTSSTRRLIKKGNHFYAYGCGKKRIIGSHGYPCVLRKFDKNFNFVLNNTTSEIYNHYSKPVLHSNSDEVLFITPVGNGLISIQAEKLY